MFWKCIPIRAIRRPRPSVDRSQVAANGAPPELKLPKLQRATLSNGLKIVLAERHEIPLVNFWLQLDAGYAADQSAPPGTASMTRLCCDGGTETAYGA